MIAQTKQLRLQVGGTVNPRTSIYIVRPSDDELFGLLQRGEYANVLCSRQMGKSSLLVRTKARLQDQGYATAALDVAGYLGTMGDANEWYQGLLDGIAQQLHLDVDVIEWWKASRAITPNQRLIQFFRDEIAAKSSVPVVIFLDEIDSTIALPFTDDFFVAIRAMYNNRASEPLFERITFCLVGVATPDELIKNLRTTPYNIGRTVELQDFDFDRDDLRPLFRVLADDPAKGKAIAETVLRWTGGHPYLTVRLCDQLVATSRILPEEVDGLINREFGSLDELHSDVHFQQVLRFLDERVEDRRTALALYQRIRSGEQVRDETTSTHIALRLSGIVKRNRHGYLVVRNPIYARVFTNGWIVKTLALADSSISENWIARPLVAKTSPFDKLLESLNSDRDLAGVEYEHLRHALIMFFQHHNCLFPEDLADKTLDRVARKMGEGNAISDLNRYCFGVAKFIALEDSHKRLEQDVFTKDIVNDLSLRATASGNLDHSLHQEQRLDCLRHCLKTLSIADREFLIRYYDYPRDHKELATQFGISPNSMRVRAYRLRSAILACMNGCMDRKEKG